MPSEFTNNHADVLREQLRATQARIKELESALAASKKREEENEILIRELERLVHSFESNIEAKDAEIAGLKHVVAEIVALDENADDKQSEIQADIFNQIMRRAKEAIKSPSASLEELNAKAASGSFKKAATVEQEAEGVWRVRVGDGSFSLDGYTKTDAELMCADLNAALEHFEAQIRREALEEAARMAESLSTRELETPHDVWLHGFTVAQKAIATAIRSLSPAPGEKAGGEAR